MCLRKILQDVLVDFISDRIGKDLRDMLTQADVDAAKAAILEEVGSDIQPLFDKIQVLTDQINNLPSTTPDFDTAVAALNEVKDAIHAKYNPPTS